MLVPKGLECAKDLFLLRRELHGAQLGQRSKRPLLGREMSCWAQLCVTCRPMREDNNFGRPLRKIVREPNLDSMVFLDRHLQLMSMHGQALRYNYNCKRICL